MSFKDPKLAKYDTFEINQLKTCRSHTLLIYINIGGGQVPCLDATRSSCCEISKDIFSMAVLHCDILDVQDDSKLPNDSGKVPKLNRVVGGLLPDCEIVSLLDGKLVGGQTPHVFQNQKDKIKIVTFLQFIFCITL